MARLRPVCTDMPTQGLFLIRQPSCVAFSLTLWTCRSGRRIIYTAYCLLARGGRNAALLLAMATGLVATAPDVCAAPSGAAQGPARCAMT